MLFLCWMKGVSMVSLGCYYWKYVLHKYTRNTQEEWRVFLWRINAACPVFEKWALMPLCKMPQFQSSPQQCDCQLQTMVSLGKHITRLFVHLMMHNMIDEQFLLSSRLPEAKQPNLWHLKIWKLLTWCMTTFINTVEYVNSVIHYHRRIPNGPGLVFRPLSV